MKRRYIFCDFDGVLTSTIETPGSYLNHTGKDYGISPTCLWYLKNLCQKTNAKVVISSNWRRHADEVCLQFGSNVVCNRLPQLIDLLGDMYDSSLPKDRHINKAQALDLWLEDNHLKANDIAYVIFDDMHKEVPATSNHYSKFILVDERYGLSREEVNKAILLFSKQH